MVFGWGVGGGRMVLGEVRFRNRDRGGSEL